jgi:hypothetical protein
MEELSMIQTPKKITKLMCSYICESPSHFVTVKPMTPSIEMIDIDYLLDKTNYQLLRQAFGRTWKYKQRRPKWFLFPDQSSRKTTKNSYELLHLHGTVQIESQKLQWWYMNHFSFLFAQNVNELRGERFKELNLAFAEVDFIKFDPKKDAVGYSTKQHSVAFEHGDAYVFGKETYKKEVDR